MQRRHDYIRVGWADCAERLDEPRFLERQECAALLHGFESFGGDANCHLLTELGNEKSFRLEIYLAAAFARRVEFGGTDAVGIPTANLRALTRYVTRSCHSSGMLAWGS